ncbi:MAG: polyhydroxyalkanoate depolymerase [Alphaproteobacteria bacterium]|nr:polyhydroxyalkanoate depolymerase [Alphaproteobacteria bacterium]
MLYQLHELQRLALMPARMTAESLHMFFNNPFNMLGHTPAGRALGSGAHVFEQFTRAYTKPEWEIETTTIGGKTADVTIEPVVKRTFCHLVHFKRDTTRKDPRLLIVAPFSGHYATLLRETVEAMLPDHDVYITDWQDSRHIPISSDRFGLSDYIDYLIDFLHFLGPDTHIIGVCQPSVPVMAAVSVMSAWGDVCVPASMTLMGGPIDTRKGETEVNRMATERDLDWFERNVVTVVPPPYAGMGRRVYPGFVQITSFMSMNLGRHVQSAQEMFEHLVLGADEAAEKKKKFYNEYLAVMDLPAEFYLDTVDAVFQRHLLPKGELNHRWQTVDTSAITRTAIFCVEGERDDISGVGQTKAALEITPNLPDSMKAYHLQMGVGHYGVFSGGTWKREIAPKIRDFIREHPTTGLKPFEPHGRVVNRIEDAAD